MEKVQRIRGGVFLLMSASISLSAEVDFDKLNRMQDVIAHRTKQRQNPELKAMINKAIDDYKQKYIKEHELLGDYEPKPTLGRYGKDYEDEWFDSSVHKLFKECTICQGSLRIEGNPNLHNKKPIYVYSQQGQQLFINFNPLVYSDDTITLPCTHVFHKPCLVNWEKTQAENPTPNKVGYTCPYCQAPYGFTISQAMAKIKGLEANVAQFDQRDFLEKFPELIRMAKVLPDDTKLQKKYLEVLRAYVDNATAKCIALVEHTQLVDELFESASSIAQKLCTKEKGSVLLNFLYDIANPRPFEVKKELAGQQIIVDVKNVSYRGEKCTTLLDAVAQITQKSITDTEELPSILDSLLKFMLMYFPSTVADSYNKVLVAAMGVEGKLLSSGDKESLNAWLPLLARLKVRYELQSEKPGYYTTMVENVHKRVKHFELTKVWDQFWKANGGSPLEGESSIKIATELLNKTTINPAEKQCIDNIMQWLLTEIPENQELDELNENYHRTDEGSETLQTHLNRLTEILKQVERLADLYEKKYPQESGAQQLRDGILAFWEKHCAYFLYEPAVAMADKYTEDKDYPKALRLWRAIAHGELQPDPNKDYEKAWVVIKQAFANNAAVEATAVLYALVRADGLGKDNRIAVLKLASQAATDDVKNTHLIYGALLEGGLSDEKYQQLYPAMLTTAKAAIEKNDAPRALEMAILLCAKNPSQEPNDAQLNQDIVDCVIKTIELGAKTCDAKRIHQLLTLLLQNWGAIIQTQNMNAFFNKIIQIHEEVISKENRGFNLMSANIWARAPRIAVKLVPYLLERKDYGSMVNLSHLLLTNFMLTFEETYDLAMIGASLSRISNEVNERNKINNAFQNFRDTWLCAPAMIIINPTERLGQLIEDDPNPINTQKILELATQWVQIKNGAPERMCGFKLLTSLVKAMKNKPGEQQQNENWEQVKKAVTEIKRSYTPMAPKFPDDSPFPTLKQARDDLEHAMQE